MKQPIPKQIKSVMAYLGSIKTPLKSATARINGAKSKGRPRTKQQPLRDDRGLEAL
jgi:hypothetical protein